MTKLTNHARTLRSNATSVARLLRLGHQKLVLAESCTGGLLASIFTETPGTSNHFCGSHVVYRVDSKRRWLGVQAKTLKNSPVSACTAEEMVRGALRKTPEATIAASVTGFLGPTGECVGKVFIAVMKRRGLQAKSFEIDLELPKPKRFTGVQARLARRDLAAIAVLLLLRGALENKKR